MRLVKTAADFAGLDGMSIDDVADVNEALDAVADAERRLAAEARTREKA